MPLIDMEKLTRVHGCFISKDTEFLLIFCLAQIFARTERSLCIRSLRSQITHFMEIYVFLIYNICTSEYSQWGRMVGMPPTPWPSIYQALAQKTATKKQLEKPAKMAVTETQRTAIKMYADRGDWIIHLFRSSSASQIMTTFISVILKTKVRCWVSLLMKGLLPLSLFPVVEYPDLPGNLTLIIAPHLRLGRVGQACPLWAVDLLS